MIDHTSPTARLGRATRRVAVVEDHLLQRSYATSLLDSQPDLDVVFSGEALPDFVAWLMRRPRPMLPQLLVLDLMVERGPSADPRTVELLVGAGVRILLFSAMGSPPLVRRMMQAGVSGIIGKRDPEGHILAAARTVLDGGEWITPELAAVIAQDRQRPKLGIQEERALVLYASGLTIDAVATAIGVKRDTAKKYLQRVKEKYAAAGRPMRSKLDMNRAALADGLLTADPASASGPTA